MGDREEVINAPLRLVRLALCSQGNYGKSIEAGSCNILGLICTRVRQESRHNIQVLRLHKCSRFLITQHGFRCVSVAWLL